MKIVGNNEKRNVMMQIKEVLWFGYDFGK